MKGGMATRELTEREKLEVDVRNVRASIHYRKEVLASWRRELDRARKQVRDAEAAIERWPADLAAAEKALADYLRAEVERLASNAVASPHDLGAREKLNIAQHEFNHHLEREGR